MNHSNETSPLLSAIDMAALMAEVEALPEKERPRRDRKTQLARSLAELICAMRAKGMTYKEIAAFLRTRRIDLSDSTLRLAMSQIEKERRAQRRAQQRAEREANKARQGSVEQTTKTAEIAGEPAAVVVDAVQQAGVGNSPGGIVAKLGVAPASSSPPASVGRVHGAELAAAAGASPAKAEPDLAARAHEAVKAAMQPASSLPAPAARQRAQEARASAAPAAAEPGAKTSSPAKPATGAPGKGAALAGSEGRQSLADTVAKPPEQTPHAAAAASTTAPPDNDDMPF